jgi:hypothetical protein
MLILPPPIALLYLAVVPLSVVDSRASETAPPRTDNIWEAARSPTETAVSRCEIYLSLTCA